MHAKADTKKHTVIVVGSGFAGVRAAQALASKTGFEVILISEQTSLRFYGQLLFTTRSHFSHILHLDTIFSRKHSDVELLRAQVVDFDGDKSTITTNTGLTLSYSSLIFALGRQARRHNLGETEVISGYDTAGISKLKRRMRVAFEQGRGVRYVVVGAGETGVSIAVQIRLYANELARKQQRHRSLAQVVLLERRSTILPGEHVAKVVRQKTVSRLKSLGIITQVDVQADPAKLKRLAESHVGGNYEQQVVVQAHGQVASDFFLRHSNKFTLAANSLVRVDDLLEVEGYSNVYAIGDCSAVHEQSSVDMALYDAEFVAGVIENKVKARKLTEYDPPDYTCQLELGKHWTLVQIGDGCRAGLSGWVLKRWIDWQHFSTLIHKRKMVLFLLRGKNPLED